MKLSKLYSNNSEIFESVKFSSGLNVVVAEIRLPENKNKDTHNLGKTTLGKLIDFCLLSKKHEDFFLFKHKELFKDFIFFIEIKLSDNTFITVRRSLKNASKISFKKEDIGNQDFSFLPDAMWDHLDIPFETAKELLDSLLDLRALKPFSYRQSVSYLIRSQDDFTDVFHPKRFVSKHSTWKPYLAHILGFNEQLIIEHYKKEDLLEEKQKTDKILASQLSVKPDELSKIEGMLLLKREEIENKQKLLDSFDFDIQDKEKTKQLVDDIDFQLADLNSKRYYLLQSKKKIDVTLSEEEILFNPAEADQLFRESQIYFAGQIKKDFEQLVEFNSSITKERKKYLMDESKEIEEELKNINPKIDKLNIERRQVLSFLTETDIFNKYRKFSDELVNLKADITHLENQKQEIQRLQNLRKDIRVFIGQKEDLETLIEENYQKNTLDKNSIFSLIRIFFNEIIEEVIGRKALLNVALNNEYHLIFSVEVLDEIGVVTSADQGTSYQKLLCIAFDMAVARVYAAQKFPHFIFHDGVFESLDDRKKENLLHVIRRYTENFDIQQIITLIDSDLPVSKNYKNIFNESEIILCLHDENIRGQLFKMKSW